MNLDRFPHASPPPLLLCGCGRVGRFVYRGVDYCADCLAEKQQDEAEEEEQEGIA